MSRKEEVLAAAVVVTSERGVRGLTHRAVDTQGGLPAGTTSNFFRSRRALVDATFGQLAAHMEHIIATVGEAPVANEDDLIALFGQNLGSALGPGRVIAAGLAAMFCEAAMDENLQATAAATTRLWLDAIEKLLISAGVDDDVEGRARYLLSFANGLVMDQLALRETDFDATAAFRFAFRGFYPH